jgi:hypothetical protein
MINYIKKAIQGIFKILNKVINNVNIHFEKLETIKSQK